MEGLSTDVVLVVSIGLVVVVSLAAYLARKFGSNGTQEGGAAGWGGGGGIETSEGGNSAAGRLARHPGGECPICLSVEVETPVQTNCGHWFCARCILGYYDGLGRVRIRCPICRQEVNMLHGAAENPTAAATPVGDAAAEAASDSPDAPAETAAPSPPWPPSQGSPETQERLVRFNERSTRRRRTPWQVVGDAPLLLRRLWSDLRRGDTQVYRELIRRGVQLQLFMVVLYILSPVDFVPESLLGIAGLLDDVFIVVILVLHITTVYRTILLSWERSRAARAAAATATAVAAATTAPDSAAENAPAPAAVGLAEPGRFDNSPLGAGLAAVCAVLVASLATFAGAGSGVSAIAAGAMGVAAAAASSASSDARNVPPLAGDW